MKVLRHYKIPTKPTVEVHNFLWLGRYHHTFFSSLNNNKNNKLRLTTTTGYWYMCHANSKHTHVAALGVGYCAWNGITVERNCLRADFLLKTISGRFACRSPEHTKLVGARAKGALLGSCCTGGPTTATIIYYSQANTIHRWCCR